MERRRRRAWQLEQTSLLKFQFPLMSSTSSSNTVGGGWLG
jgi:hypothetical protein